MKYENFRIVRWSSPYQTWQNSDPARVRLFHEIIKLKFAGYRSEYAPYVLPVDTYDFIGDHLLICRQDKNGDLLPLSGYKSISLATCLRHGITFPLPALLRLAGSSALATAVEEECEKSNPTNIRYDYSYTMNPEVRKDRALALELRDALTALHYFDHRTRGSQTIFLTGVERFKMPRLFESWGYEDFARPGHGATFKQKSLFGESVRLMKWRNFPTEMINIAERYTDVWENRIDFTNEIIGGLDQERAA